MNRKLKNPDAVYFAFAGILIFPASVIAAFLN